MDQRRFIAFLMLSLAVLIFFDILFPRARVEQDADQPAAEVADGAAGEVGPDGPRADDDPAADVPLVDRLPEAAAAAELGYVALGSLDPESGYRMLVIVTNRGAAVHRTEFSSPRYRDQHDRTGYLGELEWSEVEEGIQARVVGAGTPAAVAGIEVGDVVVGFTAARASDEQPIRTVEDLAAELANTRPRQQITLHVRGESGEIEPREVRLIRRPFAPMRPEIDNYRMREAESPPDLVDRPSFLATLLALGGGPLGEDEAARVAELLEEGNWELAAHDQSSAEFRMSLPDLGLDVVKRYTLEPVPAEQRDDVNYPGYHFRLDIELQNTGESPQRLVYRLDGPTGMPLEGWWYAHKISQRWFSGAGLRDVAMRFVGSPAAQIDCSAIAQGKVEPMGHGRSLAYAGIDGQYFSAVLMPRKDSLDDVWFDTTEAIVVGPKPEPGSRTRLTFTNVTCRLTRQQVELPPGESVRDSFDVFVGPKRPDLLAQYQTGDDPRYSLRYLIYYGWFGWVAQPMLGILHWFYGIVGNYGIAIILLTVLVRGTMFPISYKQTQNIARMQALKPEMDKLTEKYKGDMQKRSQAMQELYRKHKINPLGGCLPMFIQLPIFIGLYRALMIDVELRDSPLFTQAIRWCSNLAAPDMLLDWSSIMPRFVNEGIDIFSPGPYLNVLPLVTVALFLITQKMIMPAPTNEQAAMQQKIMKYMTVFMGVIFYKVASGLCLYFIASSIWGIGERKLLPKVQKPEEAPKGDTRGQSGGGGGKRPPTGGPKPTSNGSPKQKKRGKAKRKR